MAAYIEQIVQSFEIFLGTFLILTVGFNFNPQWRRYPWDMSIDKFGFRIYIPIITSMGMAVALSIMLQLFKISRSGFVGI